MITKKDPDGGSRILVLLLNHTLEYANLCQCRAMYITFSCSSLKPMWIHMVVVQSGKVVINQSAAPHNILILYQDLPPL